MQGLGILILIVLFFWLCWPSISRWLKRKAIQKAESYVRSRMGMPPPPPPHDKTRHAGKQHSHPSHEPLIPKEYAEDVEFVETIDHSESHSNRNATKMENYNESQISDAEWTEIKSSGSK